MFNNLHYADDIILINNKSEETTENHRWDTVIVKSEKNGPQLQ